MEFITIQRIIHLLLSRWRVDGDRRSDQRIRHLGVARPVPVGHSQRGGCSYVGIAVLVRIGGSNVLRVVPQYLLQAVSSELRHSEKGPRGIILQTEQYTADAT